jgi:ubiquinol-cytochrome c reductase iron-sulfur subunit
MSERVIAGALIVAIAASIGLSVVYALGGQPQLEGTLLALALGGIGIAAISWGNHLMPNGPFTQSREELATRVPSERVSLERRPFLTRLLVGAGGALGVALVFPLRSLGPNPGNTLNHTSWTAGARLVDSDGTPVSVVDLPVGGVLTVFPSGHTDDASAQTILIRADDRSVATRRGRETWSPQGYLAFSKVCTHAGCPVGLYEHRTKQLLCPCHQSLFDVIAGARPVFGPAPRSLPQLPLAVDGAGYLIAQRDYDEPVGPAFWNRR